MELGHDDLGRRHAFLAVDAGRDAAAIVLDRDRSVGVQLDDDPVAMPGQRFVDRIVAETSNTMWWRPEPSSVSPIYMPGRLRTASRPFSTLIESAP
jgi:hypothetical protein